MITPRDLLVRCLPGLFAVAAVLGVPALLRAETVIFRNECRVSVVVQTASVVNGMVQRDTPMLLRPGEYTPKIKLDTDKIVTVFDARSNKVLFREKLLMTDKELGYGIQPDPNAMNKVRLYERKRMKGKGEGVPGK